MFRRASTLVSFAAVFMFLGASVEAARGQPPAQDNVGDAQAVQSASTDSAAAAQHQKVGNNHTRLVDLYDPAVYPFSKFAIGVEFGTQGLGLQMATPLTRTLSLRAGADFLNTGYRSVFDSAVSESEAHLRTGHVSLDCHPFGKGFRISPGVLFLRSNLGASVYVAGGTTFVVDDSRYISSPTDPMHGSAHVGMAKTVMPSLTIGWGNIFGHLHRHWSIPFEIGAAYAGHYTIQLKLTGSTCQSYTFTNCESIASQELMQDVKDDERDVNETIKRVQVYPLMMTGFAYRF